jgi:hypothetical protein
LSERVRVFFSTETTCAESSAAATIAALPGSLATTAQRGQRRHQHCN